MEILSLGKGTDSLTLWPMASLKGENRSTSWKKVDPFTGLMLGCRDPKRLSVLLGPTEGGKAPGVHWLLRQERAIILSDLPKTVQAVLGELACAWA